MLMKKTVKPSPKWSRHLLTQNKWRIEWTVHDTVNIAKNQRTNTKSDCI